jgi:hypothetical protein
MEAIMWLGHHLFFSVIVGFLLGRMLFRMLRWRRGFTLAGGHCGHGFRRQFIDDRGGGLPFSRLRRRRWGDAGAPAPVALTASQRVADLLGKLELNARQKADADEAWAAVRDSLGARFDAWQHVDAIFAAVVAPAFDRARVEAALDHVPEPERRKELVDGLEHLHNILTAEQRSKLRPGMSL